MLKNYNQIVIELGGFVSTWEDNFNDGQIGDYSLNTWDIKTEKLIFKKITKKEIKEIKKAIFNKLNDNLYKNISIRTFNKYVEIIDNRVIYSQYTNDDNTREPNRKECREFKQGIRNLYVQDINITVSINSRNIEESDLEIILKGGR